MRASLVCPPVSTIRTWFRHPNEPIGSIVGEICPFQDFAKLFFAGSGTMQLKSASLNCSPRPRLEHVPPDYSSYVAAGDHSRLSAHSLWAHSGDRIGRRW